MMNKHKFTLLALVLLAGLNITLLYVIFDEDKTGYADQNYVQCPEIEDLRNGFSSYLNSSVFNQVKNNGRRLPGNLTLLDSGNKEIKINDLKEKLPFIVADFRNASCKVCLENEVARLRQISEEVGEHSVLLIDSFISARNQRAFESSNGIRCFQLPGEQTDGFPDTGYPCLFVVSRDLVISDLFLLSSDLGNITDNYFDQIKRKFFEKI